MLLRNLSIIGLFALQPVFAQVEPKAGTWSTWVVSSVSQVRLPSPPTAANTTAEIQAIKSLMPEGNDTTRARLAGYEFIQKCKLGGLIDG